MLTGWSGPTWARRSRPTAPASTPISIRRKTSSSAPTTTSWRARASSPRPSAPGPSATYHQPSDDLAHVDLTFMGEVIQSLVEPVQVAGQQRLPPRVEPGDAA
jgi:hypothetical protein